MQARGPTDSDLHPSQASLIMRAMLRICPKSECVEPFVHGHGGDEKFTSRQHIPGRQPHPGSLDEALLAAFAAGSGSEPGSESTLSAFTKWRRTWQQQ